MTDTSVESPNQRQGARRSWLIVGVLIAVLALLWGAVQIVLLITQTEYADSAEFAGTQSILVDSDNGDITIVADPDAEEISVQRTVELAGWGGAPGGIGAVADGRLEIADVCDDVSFLRNCSVDYEITVPEGTTIDVSADSGNITVEGATASVVAENDSGNIEIDGAAGDVVAENDSGDITLSGIEGKVTAQNDSGAITGTDLSATTFAAENSSGDITATFVTDPDAIEASSGSGNVELTVPGTATYDVDASSGSGTEDVTVDVDTRDGNPATVSSDSGDVTLRKA